MLLYTVARLARLEMVVGEPDFPTAPVDLWWETVEYRHMLRCNCLIRLARTVCVTHIRSLHGALASILRSRFHTSDPVWCLQANTTIVFDHLNIAIQDHQMVE